MGYAQDLVNAGYYGYAGWSDAAAQADFAATRGSGKGGPSSGSGSSGSVSSAANEYLSAVDKASSELKEIAKENYDFAIKQLERDFTTALGKGDSERANFIKSVANSLEEKVGSIKFDYDEGVYRLKEDTTKALTRLDEDSRKLFGDFNTQTMLEREQQGATLNSRGILSSTREGAEGLAGKEVGTLEDDIERRREALERSVNRQREDTTLNQDRGLTDLETQARRNALLSQRSYDVGKESADAAKKAREREIEAQKYQQKAQVSAFSRYV